MLEYLLVFYLLEPDYSDIRLRYALGPMTRDACIDLSLKTPELAEIYEIKDTIWLCTKLKDFRKNHPGKQINSRYL